MELQTQRWRFSCVDSWFFREARSHDAVGVTQLATMFPPPQATVLGAARHLIATAMGVDWQRFGRGEQPDIQQVIGRSEDLGSLNVIDYRLVHCPADGHEHRLYPVPAALLAETAASEPGTVLQRLQIGPPVRSDLGYCCLPMLSGTEGKARTLENYWITETGLQQWLQGEIPASDSLISLEQHTSNEGMPLLSYEARLGIARTNHSRTVTKGLLYQTTHVRLADELKLELVLSGVPAGLELAGAQSHSVRLGGEGRPAAVEISEAKTPSPLTLDIATTAAENRWLIIMLASAGDFATGDGEGADWCLPGFTAVMLDSGLHCYQGELPELPGVQLRIHSAALGRAERQGGWDLALRQPKAVRSLVPAGSCYYCEVLDGSASEVIAAINQGTGTGKQQSQGRGQLLAGNWPEAERPAALVAGNGEQK
ncbi:MAG: hypothetical protein OIF57_05965 [Marinobacterium sp.]|nr:hypothetical protein [Marinobacterium sp.]